MPNIDIDKEISVFSSVKSTNSLENKPLGVVLMEIMEGKYQETVKSLRNAAQKDERQEIKRSLPMVAFHGKFENKRQKKDFFDPTGIIIIDIDDVFDDLEEVKSNLIKFDKHILAAMISPSGNGIKALYRVDPKIVTQESYRLIGQKLAPKFREFGKIDVLSVTDCLIMSYDSNMAVNLEATIDKSIQELKVKKHVQHDVDLELDETKELWECPQEFYETVLVGQIRQKSDNNYKFIQMSVFDLARFGFKGTEHDLDFIVEHSEACHKPSGANEERLREAIEVAELEVSQQSYPYKRMSEEWNREKFVNLESDCRNEDYSDNDAVDPEEEEWDGLISYDNIEQRVRDVYDRGERAGLEISLPNFNEALRFVKGGVITSTGIPGHGKAQTMTSKIYTRDGYKLMGDIAVGDKVLTKNGVTVVDGVFPQGVVEVFKVIFSDGSSTECCDNHIWSTQTRNDNRRRQWKNRTLKTIRKSILCPDGRGKYRIPVECAKFADRNVELDPYTLGILIGDGSITQSSPRFSNGSLELLNALRCGVEKVGCKISVPTFRGNCYSTVISGDGGVNIVSLILRNEGLNCVAKKKRIPKKYIYNSIPKRMSLLSGLLDTDGTISKQGHISYSTVSKQLAEDILSLTQSLGGVGRISLKTPTYNLNGTKVISKNVAYNVSINLPEHLGNPFTNCRHKSERWTSTSRPLPPKRFIVAVENIGYQEAQCVSVKDESHLYFTDNFIVTHNTDYNDQIIIDLLRLHNWKTLIAGWEQSEEEHLTKLGRKLLGFYPKKGGDFEMKDRATKMISRNVKHLDVNRIGGDIDRILKYCAISIEKYKIDMLILDPFNHMSTKSGGSDHARSEDVLRKLAIFAKKHDVLIILVAHPTKMPIEESTGKFKVPNLYNVKGTSAFYEMTYHGWVVYRDDKDINCPVMVEILKVKQNNLGEKGAKVFFKYDKPSGRFIPVDADGEELDGDWNDRDWIDKYYEKFGDVEEI